MTPTLPPHGSDAEGPALAVDAPWHRAGQRLPRKGQHVRILTTQGISSEATFEVEFTEDWPEGVSWRVSHGDVSLPFGDVFAWSPDPDARPPAAAKAAATAAPPVSPVAIPPAITFEIEHELAQTAEVLRCIPRAHLDWTPHPAVPTLRVLGQRLVRIVARMGWILELDSLDRALEPILDASDDLETIISQFKSNVDAVHDLVRSVDGARLREAWTLSRYGAVVATLTRGEALRRYGLTPVVYHRGEIGLMLSAIGVPAPHPYPHWTLVEEGAPADWAP